MAAWQPHETYKIKSYAAEMFPELFSSPDAEVRSIKAERTFWEKITILHQEAHRPESSPQPHGYSRHYYDVFQLAESNVKDSALSDLSLFREVVDFKKKFYPRFWARYDLAVPGTIRLYPPEHVLHSLAKDYVQMHIMIYGQYPDFEVMINRIKLLEVELNKISP